MSISAIAAQLYTIQSRKNLPLSTAINAMVREDLAMRFSVYNLAKIITKSDFIATVAQTAFGSRTPMQKKQDEVELRKQQIEKKFKQFTVSSITSLTRKIDLLSSITQRNTALISNVYSELGAFRMQQRININTFNARSVRIPGRSKTIRAQIEEINRQLQQLQVKEGRPGVRGITAKKKKSEQKTKENSTSLFNQFLPFLLGNPRLLGLLGVGALRAVGLGTLALKAYALYNLPGAVSRMTTRAGGQSAYDDPITESTSQTVDPLIAAGGTYTATKAIMDAASMIKNRGKSKLELISDKDRRKQMQNNMAARFRDRGMTSQQAFGTASKRTSQYIKYSKAIKKFQIVDSAIKGLGKKLPGIQLASLMFILSRMSNTTANRASGKISQEKYKEEMIDHYSNLIEYVGIPAMGSLLGGLAGSALFPGIGTLGGALVGGISGYVASLFLDEKEFAESIFVMIHEDKVVKPKSLPPMNLPEENQGGGGGGGGGNGGGSGGGGGRGRGPPSNVDPSKYPTTAPGPKSGPLSVRNNNPGNLRYYASLNKPGYVLSDALPGPEESFAMFPTPKLGIEAMRKQLTLDTKRGMVLSTLINKYAPKSDGNDPVKYANAVSRETGVKLNEVIPLDRIRHVMSAMIRVEGMQEAVDYYKPYLQMTSVVPRPDPTAVGAAAPTAQTVNIPPAAASPTVPNTVAQPPPNPVVAQNNDSKNSDNTAINAQAGLIAAERLNAHLNAGLKVVGDRILKIEKGNPLENPGYRHNDSSLQPFSVNQYT